MSRRHAVMAAAFSATVLTTGCNPDNPFIIGQLVTVEVKSGGGNGNGLVTSEPASLPPSISCQIDGAAATGVCTDDFSDAGGGGTFQLQALPATGSRLVSWTGCDGPASAALLCDLSFDPGPDVKLDVTARFDLDACYEIKQTVPNSIAGTGPATPADLSPAYGAEALANPSIEQVVTIGTTGQLLPSAYGYWQGDRNSRVGAQQSITPFDGAFMLQFIASGITPGPTGTAELIQLVKVSHLEPDVAAGAVRATVRARFNRVGGCPGETDTSFLIVVAAMPGEPSEAQTRWSIGAQANTDNEVAGGWLRRFRTGIATDADPASWQELQLVVDVPPGTTYLVVDLGATENVFNDDVFPELHGHYLDAASVVLSRVP